MTFEFAFLNIFFFCVLKNNGDNLSGTKKEKTMKQILCKETTYFICYLETFRQNTKISF